MLEITRSHAVVVAVSGGGGVWRWWRLEVAASRGGGVRRWRRCDTILWCRNMKHLYMYLYAFRVTSHINYHTSSGGIDISDHRMLAWYLPYAAQVVDGGLELI